VAQGRGGRVGVRLAPCVNDGDRRRRVDRNRLEALQRQIMKYTATVLRGETLPASLAAGLLKDVAALRPEIVSLRTESIRGAARSSAARSAMVDLVTALSLARVCGVV
jgi:hypothetical protein